MAQLGDLGRAKTLLRGRRALSARKEAVARARCIVAEAEIALVSRDLGWPTKALDAARAALGGARRRTNAAHARLSEARGCCWSGASTRPNAMLAQSMPPCRRLRGAGH